MNYLPRLVKNALSSLKSCFSIGSFLPESPASSYIEKNKEHLEKYNTQVANETKVETPEVASSPREWQAPRNDTHALRAFLGNTSSVLSAISSKSIQSVVAKKPQLKFAAAAFSLTALFALALLGHSLGFTRLAHQENTKVVGVLSSVLGSKTTATNELLLDQGVGFGLVEIATSKTPRNDNSSVLQATTTAPSGIVNNVVIDINAPTNIRGTLSVNGITVVNGTLSAPNLINTIIAGDNIVITSPLSTSPTISIDLPDTLVYSLQGKTGELSFSAGTGVTVSGTTISASLTLAQARAIGGCTACITNSDLASLTVAKGGTELTGLT
ncbi:MAG: hypothetical protein Q7S79_00585, partial [bacterium]|nr:hypothetical protein [bacterium]